MIQAVPETVAPMYIKSRYETPDPKAADPERRPKCAGAYLTGGAFGFKFMVLGCGDLPRPFKYGCLKHP